MKQEILQVGSPREWVKAQPVMLVSTESKKKLGVDDDVPVLT